MILIVVLLTPLIQVAVYLIYRKKEALYKEYAVGLKYSIIVISHNLRICLVSPR